MNVYCAGVAGNIEGLILRTRRVGGYLIMNRVPDVEARRLSHRCWGMRYILPNLATSPKPEIVFKQSEMESCQIVYSNWGSISWAIVWCVVGIVIGIILEKKVIK